MADRIASSPGSAPRAMLTRDLSTRKISYPKPRGSKVARNNRSSRGPGNEARGWNTMLLLRNYHMT